VKIVQPMTASAATISGPTSARGTPNRELITPCESIALTVYALWLFACFRLAKHRVKLCEHVIGGGVLPVTGPALFRPSLAGLPLAEWKVRPTVLESRTVLDRKLDSEVL
jgi:hypothetical protein